MQPQRHIPHEVLRDALSPDPRLWQPALAAIAQANDKFPCDDDAAMLIVFHNDTTQH